MIWFKKSKNNLLIFLSFILVIIKLFLVSNDSVFMLYSPLDDSLYVNRAYNFLLNFSYGDYDSHLLTKLPGFSLFLAFTRFLGIPYIFFINIFYIIAGIYFIFALNKFKLNKLILFITFIIYLFNPITFSQEWFRVIREPLATILLIFLVGSFIHIVNQKNKKDFFSIHFLILIATFSFSVINREEDILLFFLVIPFLIYIILVSSEFKKITLNKYIFLKNITVPQLRLKSFLIILIPIFTIFLIIFFLKAHIFFNYGYFILNDFNSGEFPKLISSLKKIETSSQNRYVTISQEKIKIINSNIPKLRNIFELLPKPSYESYSCKRFKICNEITDGWSFFWLKDAIYRSQKNTTLFEAQNSIKWVSDQIEKSCNEKVIKCSDNEYGLISPFKFVWFKPFIFEAKNIFTSILFPSINLANNPLVKFELDDSQGKVFQYLTISGNYDSYAQKNSTIINNRDDKNIQSIYYWLKYPDVLLSDVYGFTSNKENGALDHFLDIGQKEGRTWVIEEHISINNMITNYLNIKNNILWIYTILFPMLFFTAIGLAFYGLFNNLCDNEKEYMRVFYLVLLFLFFKIIVLSHISTYMGYLDFRLFFSSVTSLLLISPTLIYKSFKN